MTEEAISVQSPSGGKSPHSPNGSETSEKTSPALSRFYSLKSKPKGDGTNHRSLWGDIKRRATNAFVQGSIEASSVHDGSRSPSSTTSKKPGGQLASRIASRLRLAKGARSSAEFETADSMDGGETPRHRVQVADGHGLSENGALDSLATPRVGSGRRWFPSGRLMRSSSCVTSGVLEPRVMLPPPDEEDLSEDSPSLNRKESLEFSSPASNNTLAPAEAREEELPGKVEGPHETKTSGSKVGEETESPTVVDVEIVKRVLKEAAEKLRAEVTTLEQMDPATRRTGYDAKYELLRNQARSREPLPCGIAAKVCNRAKNRYGDILPYDATRVVLKGGDRESIEGGDYINASHIDSLPCANNAPVVLPHYIAAQGPLENSVVDFWEMVVQEKCVAVLMLSREIEGTKAKCGHYFPEEEGKTEEFGHIRVTTLSSEELEVSDGTTLRILRIENTRDPGSPAIELSHFHHEDWPDHGAPRKTGPVRKLIRHIRTGPLSEGPFLVHCSAGIGRTGTYCCIDFTVRRLLAGDLSAVDIPATIEHMRRQRTGMVQSRDQFRFCYNAILQEVEEFVTKSHLLKGEGIKGA